MLLQTYAIALNKNNSIGLEINLVATDNKMLQPNYLYNTEKKKLKSKFLPWIGLLVLFPTWITIISYIFAIEQYGTIKFEWYGNPISTIYDKNI